MKIVKFNNGTGALLCNDCGVIIDYGFNHEDKIYLCNECLGTPMTPQEIVDHKNKWKMANYFESHTHTDLRSEVTQWCKDHCFKWRYDIKRFTDIYGDTVRFELEEDFTAFNDWYKERING